VGLLIYAGPAFSETYSPHTDLEFRLGLGVICGTCDGTEGFTSRLKGTAQFFGDRLFPVATIGSGALEIGPYAKAALLAGPDIPQVAGGVAFGYRLGRFELVTNLGLAYSTERLESSGSDPGETKFTYDLGMTLRYDIGQYFLSGGYQHNSNGSHFDIDAFHGKGSNPGYDNIFAGVGIHF
jgi:hypothetical protein